MTRFPRTFVIALAAAALLPVTVRAQERYLVTLRSGFSMEASRLEERGNQLVLGLGEGEILFAVSEVATVTVLPSPEPAPAAAPEAPAAVPTPDIEALIRGASERHGIPEAFVRSVAEAESALRPDAVSPKGAQGVMQLMPDTARALGVDPYDPAENIEGGAKLLRELLLRYQNDPDQVRRALAAYNAGQGAVKKYNGVPPYRETQQYVERVLRRYSQKTQAAPTNVQ